MKKPTISKLFLYRHRFVIGYIFLAIAFIAMLSILPLVSPNGLSEAEMQSVVTSHDLTTDSILKGTLVDAPYHALQKLSIHLLGLSTYSIKLPSIIIGAILGLLLVLLLNRWFKSNVAIFASILAVLSSSFLSVAGSGTPLIMVVFWPTLLLWLGSKIQGVKKPNTVACFVFAFVLFGSIFTPYLSYLAIAILLYVLVHPHLRFTIKSLPKLAFIPITFLLLVGISAIVINIIKNTDTLTELFFMKDFSPQNYLENIKSAILPFFSWSGRVDSTFLAPMVGLASFALAVIGLISTRNGFFASRNSIATYIAIFTVIISGFNPNFAILLILSIAILMAHGIRYILNKWYNLFPENPYARIFGVLPIGIFMGIIIVSDLSHFIFGYRYNPSVANNFSNDLVLINENLEDKNTLLVPKDTIEYDFYKLLEHGHVLENDKHIYVNYEIPDHILNGNKIVTLGKWDPMNNLVLDRIVTNEKSQNSDRLYIYTVDVSQKAQSELSKPGNK